MKMYKCIQCNKESEWGRTKVNKYCSNVCQGLFKWENETKPRIEEGIGPFDPGTLKKYLAEIVGEFCTECGQNCTHNNKPLVLQLDHIDGDSDNNRLKNLRLLCPNCHSQTENFGSKGKGSRYKKNTKRNSYLREYKSLGA